MNIPTVLVPNCTFPDHAAVGLHVNFGSADENSEQRGQAHLLEHVLVRTHFPQSLALKATTGRERTSFQIVTKTCQVRRTVEDLIKLVHRRIDITNEILTEEKGVVAREIAERRHTRSWRVREATFRALWEGTSYSYDPLGRVADWANTGPSSLVKTLEQHYYPNKAVLVVVGNSKLEDQLESASREHSLAPTGRQAPLLRSPRHVRLRWGGEELGHVLAWQDWGAQPRARLVNRMGKAKFQQLALRGGWLTWVWVPPDMNTSLTIESQLTETLSALSGSRSDMLSEHRCEEIKRSERVETRAADTVESLWSGSPTTSPFTLIEGLEYWRSLVQKARL